MKNKSFEQLAHDYSSQIFQQRHKIIDDFFIAYAAQLSHLENFCLDDICIVEEQGGFKDGKITTKFWMEYKPKFNEDQI